MENEQKYTHMIWDWNGTLFNDVEWCLSILNTMLSKRGIKTVRDVREYRCVFQFPIIEYYKNVGFDLYAEPFEELAVEFIELYHSNNSGNCKLFPHTEDVLEAVRERGLTQAILSASKTNLLLSQINEFDIQSYFKEICGITDIYAKSKIDAGLDYIASNEISKALLIGDTVHDFEAANALDVDCLLIAAGHQNREKLLVCGVPVLDNITQVTEHLSVT